MITEIEDFYRLGCGRCPRFATSDCSTRRWIEGLLELRRICLDVGLEETVKWGNPCFMHAGRNVAMFGAFRGDFRLTFFHGALLRDPERLLEKAGPNAEHPSLIRFTDNDDVVKLEPVIRSYLHEAMGYAEAGVRPPKETRDLELPDELVEAMDADPELAEAFHRLTPGRQKSYVIHLEGAKKPETRIARIAKARDKIIAGKGALER